MMKPTTLVCAILVIATTAAAEPRRVAPARAPLTANDWYELGAARYTVGDFERAAEAFQNGFELETVLSRKSAFLYDVAQAYRRAGNCSGAQLFYRRYLVLKAADTNKPLRPEDRHAVEDQIREVESCMKRQAPLREERRDIPFRIEDERGKAIADRSRITAAGARSVEIGDPHGRSGGANVTERAAGDAPTGLSARLSGGAASVRAGHAFKIPIQPTIALIFGYPLTRNNELRLDVGGGFTYTPVPYDRMLTGAHEDVSLVGVLANGAASYAVSGALAIRGDVGLGVLVVGGASNSPLTDNARTTGALSMFHVRVSASIDYAITTNIVATATPFAFSYSPRRAGLGDDINALMSFDFLIGLGYRM